MRRQRFLSRPAPPGPAVVQSQRTTQSPRRPLNLTYSVGSMTLSFLEWLGAGSAAEARPKGDMWGWGGGAGPWMGSGEGNG